VFQLRNIELLALLFYAASTAAIGLGIVLAIFRKRELRWLGLSGALVGTVTAGVITLFSHSIKISSGASLIDANLLTLAQGAAGILLPIVGGVVLVVAVMAGALWLHRRGLRRLIWAAPVTLSLTSFAGVWLMTTASLAQTDVKVAPGATTGLSVPRGFEISAYYLHPLDTPTGLAVGPDGNLYVATFGGKIVVLHDPQHTGQATSMTTFASGLDRLSTLAWHGQDLYVEQAGKITVLRDTTGHGQANWSKDIVTGLPAYVYPLHANFGLAFGPDGRLYFGVGSTSNASPEQDPQSTRMWSVNLDGSDRRLVAIGVRNTFGVAFNSAGDLFVTDNGPNWVGAGSMIGDEIKQVVPNGHYGFPAFGMPRPSDDWLPPTLILPPHVSPTGITFYDHATGPAVFPAEYQNNAFVAFWNSGQVARVQFTKMADGSYAAHWNLFAQGLHNPLGITTAPDGNIFVSDFGTGTIYRIGATSSTNVAQLSQR